MVMASIFTEAMVWVWLVLLVVAIVFEALTPSDLVSIWFACGALVSLIVAIFLPKLIWLQVVLFFVVSKA